MFDGLLCFQISEKWANLQFPLKIQRQSPPEAPDLGLCPWTLLGALPQTPVIGSHSARSPWPPPLPNPKYATEQKLSDSHNLGVNISDTTCH